MCSKRSKIHFLEVDSLPGYVLFSEFSLLVSACMSPKLCTGQSKHCPHARGADGPNSSWVLGVRFAGTVGSGTCLVCNIWDQTLECVTAKRDCAPKIIEEASHSQMLDFLSLLLAKRLPLLCSQKLIQREVFTPLWLFSIWSLDDLIDIHCAVYFIRWKSTHWGIVSFPRVTLWQRVAAAHIKMIKAWPKSLAA